MKREWRFLVIDVDYHPCDPGSTKWFCERTRYRKADLQAGRALRYEDPSGLLAGIRLVAASDQGAVLEYGGEQITLDAVHPTRKLDETGRDYTEFLLYVSIDWALVVEETPDFFGVFCSNDRIASLTQMDIEALKASDAPCARYALGRWDAYA